MKYIALTISLTLSSIFAAYSQSNKVRSQGDYLPVFRKMADSLRSVKVPKEAAIYYIAITGNIYQRAQQITNVEAVQQQGTANTAFIQTLRQLLTKLHDELDADTQHSKSIKMTANLQVTVNAALQNFNRYEPPAGFSHEDYYLWTMIQVFENLDQINVGFLQAELNPQLRQAVLKRLTIQQKVIEQLKLKLSQ